MSVRKKYLTIKIVIPYPEGHETYGGIYERLSAEYWNWVAQGDQEFSKLDLDTGYYRSFAIPSTVEH